MQETTNNKIWIQLDDNDLNIIDSLISLKNSNTESLKDLPDLNSIAMDGLHKNEWLILKSAIENILSFVSLTIEGSTFEYDKEATLKKITEAMNL